MAKRLDACTPRPKYGGGTWWHRVGSAHVADDGRITVYLESIPIPDKESGNIKIMLFEPREQQSGDSGGRKPSGDSGGGRKSSAKGGRRDDIDDEIPF